MLGKTNSCVSFLGFIDAAFKKSKAPVTRIRFQWKTNDIVAVSPPVNTETMKTIMKTQTFEYAIQSGSICKHNEMKTERVEKVSV